MPVMAEITGMGPDHETSFSVVPPLTQSPPAVGWAGELVGLTGFLGLLRWVARLPGVGGWWASGAVEVGGWVEGAGSRSDGVSRAGGALVAAEVGGRGGQLGGEAAGPGGSFAGESGAGGVDGRCRAGVAGWRCLGSHSRFKIHSGAASSANTTETAPR